MDDEVKARIAKLVDQAPPLTRDQQDRLRVLLRPAWHQPELPSAPPEDTPKPADAKADLLSLLKKMREGDDVQEG